VSTPAWTPLTGADVAALRDLADSCLRVDGGLPQLSTEPMLRRHFLTGAGIGGRDETGDLIAAAAVFVDDTGRRTATGLVRPSARRQGHGAQLVAWCAEHSGGEVLRVLTETTSPETDSFLRRFGLLRTFAEQIMRHDLLAVPRVRRPAGLTVAAWDADSAPLFYAAYRGSFADRPGFPDPPEAEWIRGVEDEPGLHRGWSRVAVEDGGEPVGFVLLADDWVDQVGVVPRWRGRGLGAHLVVRSLRRFSKAGLAQAWLAVNVDNPAHQLYRRLGFVDVGLRARYEPTLAPGPDADIA
jgi:mycothiol synthase